jgi:hypothetical protein
LLGALTLCQLIFVTHVDFGLFHFSRAITCSCVVVTISFVRRQSSFCVLQGLILG